MSLYGKGDYNIPSIKRSIIRYMLASTDPKADGTGTTASRSNGLGRQVDGRGRQRQRAGRIRVRRGGPREEISPGTASRPTRTLCARPSDSSSLSSTRGRRSRLRARTLPPSACGGYGRRHAGTGRRGPMIDIPAIQSALGEFGIDGWLLYDFRGSNLLAQRCWAWPHRTLAAVATLIAFRRRASRGKLVHRIEEGRSPACPGRRPSLSQVAGIRGGARPAAVWPEAGCRRVFAAHAIPYVSRVDAGTVELIKRLGVEVVSSGDLIQVFEAAWDAEQERSHFDAAVHTDAAYSRAWRTSLRTPSAAARFSMKSRCSPRF